MFCAPKALPKPVPVEPLPPNRGFCCWVLLLALPPNRDPPVPAPKPVVPVPLPNPPVVAVVDVFPPKRLGWEVPVVPVPPPNKEVAGFAAPNKGLELVLDPNPPAVCVCPKVEGALVPPPNGVEVLPKPPVDCCPKPDPPKADVPKAPAWPLPLPNLRPWL